MTLTLYQPYLDWIADQAPAMAALTERWATINSGSYNLAGLRVMREALEKEFDTLGGKKEIWPLAPLSQIDSNGETVAIPMAEALTIRKRPEAPLQILLGGHMDTVYGPDHPFQTCTCRDGNVLNGPGVADLKGGLVVMLYALRALERSPFAGHVGWQVVINPDEEIGSVSSDLLLKHVAQDKDFGLLYEPALADGTLAGARKGSGNFTIVVRGRAAHAGRNPEAGRNAIVAAAEITQGLFALNGARSGLTLNPGKIDGGGALNVVPDLAILRFNIRTGDVADEAWVLQAIAEILAPYQSATRPGRDGFSATLHGHFTRAPKPMSAENQTVFDLVRNCATQLGQPFTVKPSGGCCDGNNLWRHGLPNVDTLGVRGADIHSADEIVYLDSLVERAQLSALLLMQLAGRDMAPVD